MVRIGFCNSGEGRLTQAALRFHAELGFEPAFVFLDERAMAYRHVFEGASAAPMYTADWSCKDRFYGEIERALDDQKPDLVMLTFSKLIPNKILDESRAQFFNVHMSLLPAFKGFGAIEQACKAGVAIAGATIHVVTSSIDGGPIIAQCAVPRASHDTPELLSGKIYQKLLPMYLQVIRWFVEGRIRMGEGGTVEIANSVCDFQQNMSPALEELVERLLKK